MSAAVAATQAADPAASAPRRKSGRVSRKPEPFVPASSRAGHAKRKRGHDADGDAGSEGAAAGDDSDEGEDDEALSSSEGEPDDEELREQRRRKPSKPKAAARKPANKKPRTNGAPVRLAMRPAAGAPKRPRKAAVPKSALMDEDARGLYADVFAHGKSVEDVAAQWIASFHSHEQKAVAELVNLVLRAAGCSVCIDEDDIGDPDNAPSKLAEVHEDFQAQDMSDYPLIAKVRGGAAFRHALHGFFFALVQTTAQTGLLYDNAELLENIEVWISVLSSAANRPFRHTSTVVALAIVTALATEAHNIKETIAKKQRQSETEGNKKRVNKSRVSEVNKEVGELEQKLQMVDSAIADWFDTIYVHRYRDVDPRIRVECVAAMADWIMTYPDRFFDGTHLRYLGWVLSDPQPTTRLEVLKQLHKLFRDKNKHPGLKTFTERFRPRMVEIATHDAETNVRAAAVELLDMLREIGFLEPDDVDSVGRLIFDAEVKVRKAVVGFFAETVNGTYESLIDEMGGQESVEEGLGTPDGDDDFENPRLEWLKLKCLVEQLIVYDSEESELPSQVERVASCGVDLGLVATGIESRFYLASQALYDAMPEIESWEILAGYLLYDHSHAEQNSAGDDPSSMLRQNCKLDENEETALLDVLNAAVKMRLSELAEAQKEKKRTKSEKEALKEEYAETIKQLSIKIPQLLKKFGALPEAASLCLRLERELDLDIYQELRQGAALTALIDDVNRQFLTHHNERVLDEAIQSIRHALMHEDTREIAESKVQGLWDDLITPFEALRRGRDYTRRGNLSGNQLTDLSNIVIKVSKLARISEPVVLDNIIKLPSKSKSKKDNTNATPPIVSLLQIIERGVPTKDLTEEAEIAESALVRNAMGTMLLYFVWKCKRVATAIESGTRLTDDDLDSIASRRDSCIKALVRIMENRKGADDLRLEAAYLLLDIYNLFYSLKSIQARAKPQKVQASNQSDEANDDWQVLCQEIDEHTTKVLMQILGAAELNLAKRTNKHLEGPGVDDDPVDPDDEPESSEDEQDEVDERAAEDKKLRKLIAESRLCFLGSRLVHGIQVGTLGESVRKRLEKNKKRLGHDWKEVVAHLDAAKNLKNQTKTKAKSSVAEKATPKPQKSKEIVVEDDSDEGEDDPEDQRNELSEDEIVDEEMADNDDVQGNANGAKEGDDEIESLLGD